MWTIAGAAAAVGAILVARRVWRLRAGFAKSSDLATTMGLSVAAMAVCAVMALRLLNAPPGLLLPVTPMHGIISAIESSGKRRHSFPSYTVEVTLDSGALVSFEVSQKKFRSLGTGYNVDLQARRGLLAMPWCLGDCL